MEVDSAEGEHPVMAIFRAPLSEVNHTHLVAVTASLLRSCGVADAHRWCPVVTCLATEAAASISPDAVAASGSIDPRSYIKVKRLAGCQTPEDSCLVQGVVCRKNLTHRKMRRKIRDARIIMLGNMLEFPRTQGRLASFDHYTKDQETEHLWSAVNQLAEMKPDVLLVEKSVARDAQDALLERNISLALNVKRSILDRLARITGVPVAASLSQITADHIAVCKEFELEETTAASASAQEALALELAAGDAKDAGHLDVAREGGPVRHQSPFESMLGSRTFRDGWKPPEGGATGRARGPGHLTSRHASDSATLEAFSASHGEKRGAAGELGGKHSQDALQGAPKSTGVGASGDLAAADKPMEQGGSKPSSVRGGPSAKALGTRTLMSFRGCRLPLGCTVLLKGSSAHQLGLVKKVLKFVAYCAYRGRLETAFLAAELASAAAAETRVQASGEAPNAATQDESESREAASGGESEATPRLGVSWMDEGAGKGVGSELNPAMAALVMASHDGSPAQEDFDEASPRLAGCTRGQIEAQAEGIARASYSPMRHCSQGGWIASASPHCCEGNCCGGREEGQEREPADARSGKSFDDSEPETTPSPSPTPTPSPPLKPPLPKEDPGRQSGGAVSLPRLPLEIPPPLEEGGKPEEAEEPKQQLLVCARDLIRESRQALGSHPALEELQPLGDAGDVEADKDRELLQRQCLHISVAKRNPGKGIICEPQRVQKFDLYSSTDVSLATFLAAASPSLQKKCSLQSCGEGPAVHMVSYLHSRGLISFSMTQLPEGKELPGGPEGAIWFWARPTEAGPQVNESVRRVLLPAEATHLSLGHFLELGLGLQHCQVHGRGLHRNFARYFGVGSSVACFHYDFIAPNTVLMPSQQISYDDRVQQQWLVGEVEQLIEEANKTFSGINEALTRLEALGKADEASLQLLRDDLGMQGEGLSAAILALCSDVRSSSSQQGDDLEAMADVPAPAVETLVAAVWKANAMRRALVQMAQVWTQRLHHPSQAAASINISRSNSLEDVLSFPTSSTAQTGAHSRAPSQDAGHPNTPTLARWSAHSASGGHFLASRAAAQRLGTSLPSNALAGGFAVEGEPSGEPLAGLPLQPPSTTVDGGIGPPPPPEPLEAEPLWRPGSADRSQPPSISRFGQEAAGKSAHPEERKGGGLLLGEGAAVPIPPGTTEPDSPGSKKGRKVHGGSVSTTSESGAPQEVPAQKVKEEGRVGSVKARVEAIERQHPVLRSISKPTWITTSRQRSTTDAVLSWLNAGRRTGGTPTAQDMDPVPVPDDPEAKSSETSSPDGSDTDSLSSSGDPAESSEAASIPTPFRDPPAAAAPSPRTPKAPAADDDLEIGGNLEKTARINAGIAAELRRLPSASGQASVLEDIHEDKVSHAAHDAGLMRRHSQPLPASGGGPIRTLEREDSQLDSHFDLSKWGVILKDPVVPIAVSAPVPAVKPVTPLSLDLPLSSAGLAITSSEAAPLKIPPAVSTALTSRPQPTVSEAIHGLNLQLPSALTAILTARRPEASATPTFGEISGRALLPPGIDERIVVVHDDEPTSVVAYFLSTREHQSYLEEAAAFVLNGGPKPSGGPPSRLAKVSGSSSDLPAIEALTARPVTPPPEAIQGSALGSKTARGGKEDSNTSEAFSRKGSTGIPAGGGKEGEGEKAEEWKVLLSSEPLHYQDALQDDSSHPPGKAKLQVTAWYAPQFAELRRRCCSGGEEAFICSLSRCRTWEARGGKTRSYFAKTADDRYIVKQLQASEKKTFQEIAPAYFRYLAGSMRRGLHTCLAKIMGVYTVVVRPASGKEVVMDILVMENIFYNRDLFPIYDLKGSERARLARDDPSDPTRVLLDQNLMQSNLNDPILVNQDAHAELERSLWSDTAFLSQLGVMDYSLLVGVDQATNTLVVGIIDFIRQYTWDKALERWVKSGMGLSKDLKAPTIQSPKDYCRRFRVAMASYFTRVPSDQTPPSLLDPDS